MLVGDAAEATYAYEEFPIGLPLPPSKISRSHTRYDMYGTTHACTDIVFHQCHMILRVILLTGT